LTSSRRQPVQFRSSSTVQSIFDAASVLLARTRLEEITTSRIALEAGISVGALYRFFPDKQSIVDAIAVRRVEEFKAALEIRMAGAEPMEPRAFLDFVIDAYVEFLDAHPDFRAISLGRHISAATRQKQTHPDIGPAALVKQYTLDALGLEVPPDLDLKLRIVTEVGDRLIGFAYEQPEGLSRAAVFVEMKALLGSYLFGSQLA
jgi:AcrR family transcriptional regulator